MVASTPTCCEDAHGSVQCAPVTQEGYTHQRQHCCCQQGSANHGLAPHRANRVQPAAELRTSSLQDISTREGIHMSVTAYTSSGVHFASCRPQTVGKKGGGKRMEYTEIDNSSTQRLARFDGSSTMPLPVPLLPAAQCVQVCCPQPQR